mmetsp:Transcript_39270/g.97029  ORF Transcript_39270/g.97029 Transcript_39270/m.97029 type:complete len:243 (-) Transcript_39270:775-1503(-)
MPSSRSSSVCAGSCNGADARRFEPLTSRIGEREGPLRSATLMGTDATSGVSSVRALTRPLASGAPPAAETVADAGGGAARLSGSEPMGDLPPSGPTRALTPDSAHSSTYSAASTSPPRATASVWTTMFRSAGAAAEACVLATLRASIAAMDGRSGFGRPPSVDQAMQCRRGAAVAVGRCERSSSSMSAPPSSGASGVSCSRERIPTNSTNSETLGEVAPSFEASSSSYSLTTTGRPFAPSPA